jgi:hypothetical protein
MATVTSTAEADPDAINYSKRGSASENLSARAVLNGWPLSTGLDAALAPPHAGI